MVIIPHTAAAFNNPQERGKSFLNPNPRLALRGQCFVWPHGFACKGEHCFALPIDKTGVVMRGTTNVPITKGDKTTNVPITKITPNY